MANPLYGGYSSSYGGASSYSSRLSADPYLSSSRYSNLDPFASSSEITKYSSSSLDFGSSLYSSSKVGSGSIGGQSSWSGFDGSSFLSGTKRSAEALYNSNVLGSHNTIGQSDALFSSNSMFKHPRLETASDLPIFPQRPGQKDCSYYMLTRDCKFGEACKFDHPIWVPKGGIPDWKEVPLVPTSESLPERPGEPDCPYYLKTQKCKFGFRCKFNHPKDNALATGGEEMGTESTDHLLPERPSEPLCAFYSKTGKCKFGANCKFHHPKDLKIPSSGQNAADTEQVDSGKDNAGSVPAKTFVLSAPAALHNSKGLPIRPGVTDCPFYLKTGSCKYGTTCRYNHPDRTSINPPLVPNIGQTVMPSAAANLSLGLINPAANMIPNIDPLLAQQPLGVSQSVYPQRPGELECDFYMKTGQCKFGERCKFHHPIDRSAPHAAVAQVQPNVKLTLAGLPRREGSVACPFYMKTGTCKYGVACKFDHPPPGEAVAMAAAQGTVGGDAKAAAGSSEEED